MDRFNWLNAMGALWGQLPVLSVARSNILMRRITMRFILILFLFLGGCMTASEHRKEVQDNSGDKVTVGTVQSGIKNGMSGAEVITVLGSPNIVTTDGDGLEVWTYDRFSSDTTVSGSRGGFFQSLNRGGAGSASSSQKTLTVIIKFDKEKKVRDFSYHTSRF